LPDLPATLIALSGLSAAAYTTKKALQEDAKPAVKAVIPTRVVVSADSRVTVVGTGFDDRKVEVPDEQASPHVWVAPAAWLRIDGAPLEIRHWGATRIDAVLTEDFVGQHAEVGRQPVPATLVVDVADGQPSEPVTLELVASSMPAESAPS
jgi:hypothetical protein